MSSEMLGNLSSALEFANDSISKYYFIEVKFELRIKVKL